eukprot:5434051-Pyramimonas_sp.AAC.1
MADMTFESRFSSPNDIRDGEIGPGSWSGLGRLACSFPTRTTAVPRTDPVHGSGLGRLALI